MKKIILSSLMLLCMTMVFTSCESDRDSNPTLVQPTSFTLNAPVNKNVDLAYSTGIPFTWSQPDYGGWPAAVNYQFEVSPTGDWSTSVAQAKADETGETVPTYDVIKTIFASCSGELPAEELAKALVRINQWDEESIIPEEMTITLRLVASTPGATDVTSNPVTLTVKPYYINAAEVYDIWYMVGNCIGNGSWGNDGPANIGVSLIPMYPAYDTDGTFLAGSMYTGYFPEGGQFKFVHVAGSWEEQLNYTNVVSPGSFLSDEDGDNHNIGIKEAGYYSIMIDADGDITIEKYDGTPTVYDMISLPGDYQEWKPENNALAAVSTLDGSMNHDWFVEETFATDAELKFAANGTWDISWGNATDFPYGLVNQNEGNNIHVPAGEYYIFFNDIMGTYTFIAVE